MMMITGSPVATANITGRYKPEVLEIAHWDKAKNRASAVRTKVAARAIKAPLTICPCLSFFLPVKKTLSI
jgi:hypothetical protein